MTKLILDWFATECLTKTKVIALTNHNGHKQAVNQSELHANVTGMKGGKTRASKSRLVLALLVIG